MRIRDEGITEGAVLPGFRFLCMRARSAPIEVLERIVLLATITFLAALVWPAPALAQEEDRAQIRVAHLSPGAPNLDVYVNDQPVAALQNLPSATVSTYRPVPVGPRNVKVFSTSDDSQPVFEIEQELKGGQAYTIGAVGLTSDRSLEYQIYEDDISAPSGGNAKLRAVYAAPDAQSVELISQSSNSAFPALGFPNATRYREVPAGRHALELVTTATDTTTIAVPDVTLSAGMVYTAFIYGQAGDGTLRVLLAPDAVLPTVLAPIRYMQTPVPLPKSGGGISLELFSLGVALVVAGAAGYVVSRASVARRRPGCEGSVSEVEASR